MNARALVFILFAAWSGICWYWYVCGIKQACGDRQDIGGMTAVTPAIEPDTAASETVIQPVTEEDYTGSIDRVRVEELEDRVIINFPYGATRRVDNEAIDDYLSRLANYLKTSGGSVTISGHTDFVADSKTNYQYGLRRAYGIRDILVKKGVKKSQIKCKSFGESKPVATNDTARGRYKNRRVEIRVNP